MYVVALVAFELADESEAEALEAVRSGKAGAYVALAATAYSNERAYKNAEKVPHSSRRNWSKRGRRG